jgi:hypothetical protein
MYAMYVYGVYVWYVCYVYLSKGRFELPRYQVGVAAAEGGQQLLLGEGVIQTDCLWYVHGWAELLAGWEDGNKVGDGGDG